MGLTLGGGISCLRFVIRALQLSDLNRCLEYSTEAHWNQTEADWRFLLANCRGYGFENEEVVLLGTTMAWEWAEGYSWIAMVLVTEVARGQGIARQLMERCLQDITDADQRALLDATDMGQKVYSKLRFSGEDRIVRLFSEQRSGEIAGSETPAGLTLSALSADDLAEAARLDAQVLGVDRRAMLADWQTRLPNAAWKLTDESGAMRGFVAGREGRVASQLGPLVADSREAATCLVAQAFKNVAGPIMIDVPEAETDWVATLGSVGFAPQRGFLRMGRDEAALPTDWSRLFAISGPDFA